MWHHAYYHAALPEGPLQGAAHGLAHTIISALIHGLIYGAIFRLMRGMIPICVINSDNMPCFSEGSWHGTSGRWSRACGGGTRVVAQREDS